MDMKLNGLRLSDVIGLLPVLINLTNFIIKIDIFWFWSIFTLSILVSWINVLAMVLICERVFLFILLTSVVAFLHVFGNCIWLIEMKLGTYPMGLTSDFIYMVWEPLVPFWMYAHFRSRCGGRRTTQWRLLKLLE